ncbi:threonine/serine exporter family protein [Anaeropeptidivorans aminofermentans]|jgi:uncharacterized membrane protein YjjB (DUF3815 family)|uniref:threonine/serine exporter family protein n=1 Tax=Anaeropeptidivorans aminofermentans TaxID=2934315 RepID=UPI002023E5C7|nr:threonine/serine exporter family protein [Anaeropeptidivorans aminofermentans]
MVLRILLTFVASLTFSLLFGVPKKELICCGLCGAIGWLIYELLSPGASSNVMPIFSASIAATTASRFFSFKRKNPITLYLIAGIIPLVPGVAIYYTMYNILTGNSVLAASYGIDTVRTAGVISLGIVIVLALPYQIFKMDFRNKA